MIGLNQFLEAVEKNVRRVTDYQNGGDGTGGKCDCIGLIIGALRLAGEKWTWTHGSNYTARYRTRNFRAVSSAGDLRVGEMVFKAREPGEEKWSLPDAYKGHPDQRDYYHVGVVTRISPLQITHCTSVNGIGGIYLDDKLGKWRFAGELSLVRYDEEEKQAETALYKATVYAQNGYPVKLRAQPTQKAEIVDSIALNKTVSVIQEVDATWAKVTADGQTGYMMRQFLIRQNDPSADGNDTPTYTLSREALVSLKALIVPLLQEIEKCLGGGD